MPSFELGIRTRRNALIIAGIAFILVFLLFDLLWFSFSQKDTSEIVYKVAVSPESGGLYTVVLPTIIDDLGQEIEAAKTVSTSDSVEVAHLQSQYGPALSFNSTGAVSLRIECSDCRGKLSIFLDQVHRDDFHVFYRAVSNFTILLNISFRYEHWSEISNVFGIKEGMFGGCISHSTLSTALPSNLNWTIVSLKDDWICGEGGEWGVSRGIMMSFMGYVAGLGALSIL